jgi:glycosyltransferase involved in cell wall biosynthesis
MSRLVSVLVPVRDEERYLDEALRSALAQHHPDVEVIVVDDGSSDASAAIARSYPVKLIEQSPRGQAAARNAALQASRGAYVTVLDGDDVWPADRLSRQVAHLEANPALDIVLGLTEPFCDPAAPRPANFPVVPGGRPLAGVAGTMLCRRRAFDAIGDWDEAIPHGEDIDWLARAKDAGLRAETIQHLVLRYRIHAGNTSRDTMANREWMLRLLRASVRRQKAEPLVSVIVPVHAGERFLGAALASVAAQTHSNVETIVVDDGSPDDSARIAVDAGARVIRQEQSGVGAARNAGVAAARGELLAFLDQDDEWLPDRLALGVDHLRERPDVDLVMSRIVPILAGDITRPAWLPERWLAEPLDGFVPSTWLVRQLAFQRVGPFDTGYEIACDSDWLARFKDLGLRHLMLDEPLVRWRVHGANGSYDRTTMAREMLTVFRRTVARQKQGRA